MMRSFPFLFIALAGLAVGQTADRFESVAVCSLCHLRIPAPGTVANSGTPVAPSALWPGSMMAHAARDPYWLAKVRSETAKTPALAEVIEDTCLRCHAPMQQYDARMAGKRMSLSQINKVGAQGVACTVCHQITPAGLGRKESFEAGFDINNERQNFGPHANPFKHPMEMHSGYTPVEGRQVLDAALCGTCHTVITPTLNAAGEVVGEFVEQAPYLEWLASDYGDTGVTCQYCHLPALEDATGTPVAQYIAHNPMGFWFPPTRPRTPFGRHVLAGGNVAVLGWMKELFPDEQKELEAKQAATRTFLGTALSLAVTAKRQPDGIEIAVKVANHTGHKLPSGFPSRRIWLHLRVTGPSGETVFESGAWDEERGEITGITGLEPHRSRISEPSQVIIYEAEMGDAGGRPTTTLLRAADYMKDNRLLPDGFGLKRPLPEGIGPSAIAPVGVGADAGFGPGGHQVTYVVPGGQTGVFRISVEALYQSIKSSHAASLGEGKSDAERRFGEMFPSHSTPVLMSRSELTFTY